jgi:hypothetical protein
LQLRSQQILERRPDLAESVFPILMQRHPHFTLEQMMVVVKIPTQELRHSRAAQELIKEGEAEGRRAEAEATTASIQALPLERLEALAVGEAFSAGVALLDFSSGAADLAAWLADHGG